MILTVTLNAALDVTYRVRQVELGKANRVLEVTSRAGGKGLNVARALRSVGEEAMVTGLAGGHTGGLIRSGLAAEGIPHDLVEIASESRRTLVLHEAEHRRTTLLSEPGPVLSESEWQSFLDRFQALLPSVGAVVLSGSLPPGLPPDACAALASLATARATPIVLDAEGENLRLGLAGRPTVATPNLDEVRSMTKASCTPLEGAAVLRSAGAAVGLVTLGQDGLVAMTPDGPWSVAPPERVEGNPTGAGDAVAAMLAKGLVRRTPWKEVLEDAVVLGAAAARTPVAGEIDLEFFRRYRGSVRAQRP